MATENQSYSECWSSNGEDFNSDSLEDLLDINDHLEVGDTVWKADAVKPDPTSYVSASDVIELISERASDDGGEYAEDFPDVSKEAATELDELLAGWIKKHCAEPRFYLVLNPAEYTLTADDLSRAALE